MSTADKLARFNLIFTFLWIVLTVPSLLYWKESILWVIVISLWANIVGHFSAYLAARSEAAQQKGYNLTEQDKAWILQHITTYRPHATTITMNTAERLYNPPS